MNRSTQVLTALGGAVAGFVAVRAVAAKRIKTLPYGYGIKLKKSVTVNAPPEQLYRYWRNLTNICRFSTDILSIQATDGSRSHWILRVPGGFTIGWDAEITVDRPGEMIGWRSLDGADLDNAGYVRFEPATGGRGTVVRVALQYNPPAGKVGAALSSVLGEKPGNLIEEALRRFKGLMEAGEIPITADEKKLPHAVEPVEMASEDSFPASDPPAWTGTTGSVS